MQGLVTDMEILIWPTGIVLEMSLLWLTVFMEVAVIAFTLKMLELAAKGKKSKVI